jgi:hypothetical protein
VSEGVSPLILLAAVSNLLAQEIERSEHQHLANARFKADLRGFIARIEAELDARSNRRHLHLANEDDSVMTND